MHYWAIKNDDGIVISFGASASHNGEYEITAAEYNALEQEQETFFAYVVAVYSGEMQLSDVPEGLRARVEAAVDSRKEAENQPEPMTDIDEALAILRGEVTE